MEDTGKTVTDSALTMAQFACFAAGPEGMVAAGLVAVGQRVFDMLMAPPAPPPLSEVVEKVVAAELVSAEIGEGQVHFNTTYRWFFNTYAYYNKSWSDRSAAALAADSEFNDARENLRESLGPQSPFINFIDALNNVTVKEAIEKAFRVWTLGVGVHLSLLKFRLLLEEGDMVGSLSLSTLLDSLDQYITDSQKEEVKAESYLKDFPTADARVAKIAALHREEWSAIDGGWFWIDDAQYWGTDANGESDAGGEEDTGSFGLHHHQENAEGERTAYIQTKRDEWDSYSKQVDTFNEWRKMYQNYAKLSNSGKGAKVDTEKYPPLSRGV